MNKQKQNIMKMIKSLIKDDAKTLTKANIALSECLAEKMQDQFGEEEGTDEMELSFDTASGDVNAEDQSDLDLDSEDTGSSEEGPYCPGCGIEVEQCCCDDEAPFCSSCGELKAECQCDDHSHDEELDDTGEDMESSDDMDDMDSEGDENTHSAELEQLLNTLKGM